MGLAPSMRSIFISPSLSQVLLNVYGPRQIHLDIPLVGQLSLQSTFLTSSHLHGPYCLTISRYVNFLSFLLHSHSLRGTLFIEFPLPFFHFIVSRWKI
jgi:hypothetical protein